MSLESDLYSHLSAYAGLTALVATRIYPGIADQDAPAPYCVYQVISRVRHYSHGGFSSLENYRIQIAAYAEDAGGVSAFSKAKAVEEQLIAAMEAWRGANSKVQSCLYEDTGGNESWGYKPGTMAFEIVSEFVVQYG